MFASPVVLFAALASMGGGGSTNPVLSTTSPKAGTLIYASTGNVPGASSYSAQWLRDGANISGATSWFYEIQEADLGTALSVRSTPNSGAPVTSGAYTVTLATIPAKVNTNWAGYNTATRTYDLAPDAAARVVLVDGTTAGPTGQIYHAANFAGATALCRAVMGDWILLPNGQTIAALLGEHQVGGNGISGLSGSNAAVIGTFDPADPLNSAKWNKGAKAIVDGTGLGRGAAILNLNRTGANRKAWVALKNIVLKCGPNDEGQVTGTLAKIEGLLVDGCVLDGVALNVQNGLSTTFSQSNETDAALIGNGATTVHTHNLKARSDLGSNPYKFRLRQIASPNAETELVEGVDYTIAYGSIVSGEYQSCTTTLAVAHASTHRLIGYVPMTSQADITLCTDVVVNRSALMYGNAYEGGRGGSSFFFGVRRCHLQDSLVHHGGWGRGHKRTTPNWYHTKTLTGNGATTVFAFPAARAKLANWGAACAWKVTINGVTQTEGSGFTFAHGSVVDDVVQGVTITTTVPVPNGQAIVVLPRTNGPDIFKHGIYASDYLEGMKIWNTIVSHDASNSKLTGQIDIERMTEIRCPMGFLSASWGNSPSRYCWIFGNVQHCDDYLQIDSANVSDAFSDFAVNPRGWAPQMYGHIAGSRFRRAVCLRVTGGNQFGIGGDANGMNIASVVNVEDSVCALTADPDVSVETQTTKTFSNNVFETYAAGTNIARASLPSGARKAALDEALARNMHTTFPAAMGMSAPVGSTDEEKEDDLMQTIGYAITSRLWNDLVRYHFNADIIAPA